jgi:hypothetical protein
MYSLWLLRVPGEDNYENVPYSLCLEFFYQLIGYHLSQIHEQPQGRFLFSPWDFHRAGFKKTAIS